MGCSDCKQVVHGAVGLTKAALHIDRADESVIEQRRSICRQCEYAQPCRSNPQKKCTCSECGCRLAAKTVIASERCPVGAW